MPQLSFVKVAACAFAIVALAHAFRLALALPVQIGDSSVPLWVSWAGLALTAGLSIWGFRTRSE